MKTAGPALARHRLARSLALAILPIALSSCNLIFLNLGYKNEEPKADSLDVHFEFPAWAPDQYPAADGYLWPEVAFSLEDDLGIKELSCTASSDDGTKSFTMTNSDPRSKYVWSGSRSLADVLGSGFNSLSFTITDDKGLTTVVTKDFDAYAGESSLGAYFGALKSEILLWHPGGVASAEYYYTESSHTTKSTPLPLTNLDDGSGPGGAKLFRGERSDTVPVGGPYDRVVFTVTLDGGQSFDSRDLPLAEGE